VRLNVESVTAGLPPSCLLVSSEILTMTPVLNSNLPQIREICVRYSVNQLSAPGAAVRDAFDPARSDINFLFILDAPPAVEYGDTDFALLSE
jgi:hypothetical protein